MPETSYARRGTGIDVVSPDDSDTLLAQARHRFAAVQTAEGGQRERERKEQRFASGRQWDSDLESDRRVDRRPCLVMNRIPQFLHQVTNQQILTPMAMRVQPVDDFADIHTAKIVQGLLRNIEVISNADVAYRTAYEAAVGQGVGYFRVLTEYESPWSFKQIIKIARVRNRFCVYLDPAHQELDGSDANWGFLVERIGRSEFCQRYEVSYPTLDMWTGIGDSWITPDEVQVAEYFYREWQRATLVRLADGSTLLDTDAPPGVPIVARRPTHLPVVWWCKINGYQLLEKTRWLGSTIPIVPVYGEERDLDGKVERTGVTHGLMDPQNVYNYMASAEAEAIGLAPRAPFIMAEGQDEGYEEMWQTANTRNHPRLVYRPVSVGGVLVPRPERNAVEPAVQAISQARLLAVEDMKASVGLYDASLGARSNETSGIAIQNRQREGGLATAHYPANLRVALRRSGMICLELLPQIYDQAQIARIIGEDGEAQQVQVNQPFTDEQGHEQLYDLTVGHYDLVVSSGPSHATQREAAAEQINALVTAFPPLMSLAGDYLVRSLDMQYGQEIAARVKTQVPPEALAATETGRPEDQVAGLRNQVQQLSQQLQALNTYAQQAEGQQDQLQQQVQQLTLRLATKEDEVRLKGRALDLKQQELELKRLELQLDHQIDLEQNDIKAAQVRQSAAHNGRGQDA